MIKKYKHTTNIYLIIFLTCFCFVSSCTYDYFEDETNYVLYVPRADKEEIEKHGDNYKVDHFRFLIYKTNDLVRERSVDSTPDDTNERTKRGNYHYRLYPGAHRVYCFTNISDYEILESQTVTTARFNLKTNTNGVYQEPTPIALDYRNPNIILPGPLIVDTAYLEHKLVGRISFAFKNMAGLNPNLTAAKVKKVKITAKNVGTVQYLDQIHISATKKTRSSRLSPDDKMELTSRVIENLVTGYDFGFQNYYLPSLSKESNPNDAPMNFAITFLDENDVVLDWMEIDAPQVYNSQTSNYENPILHMNETLVITIDGNKISTLTLDDPEDWNSNINTGGELEW